MCGITGAGWIGAGKEIGPEILARMCEKLAHRGPDASGTYLSEGIALGHRRLSIIDLSPLGRQPIANENQTIFAVVNGEIYNDIELREVLESKGHVYRGRSDSETVVHLYEEYGEDFPKHINGMFAIAIWDANRRRLILVRDRIGKKPLVYKLERDRIIFASELKSILEVPGVEREIDLIAFREYLVYQYVPFPRTIFNGISKLPPASIGIWHAATGSFSVKSYWDVDFSYEDDSISFEESSERLRELLESSVRLRLRSEVPLGTFLSGGIDSSVTTGLAQKIVTGNVASFSIGFTYKDYDETEYARAAAARFGTDHHEFIVSPDAREILPELVRFYDEPFADSSAIPCWYLSRETRKHVTVAFSGDGGDELFAGYDRYRAVRLGKMFDYLPGGIRSFIGGPLRNAIPGSVRQKSTLRRLKRFLEAVNMPSMERYLQWIAIFNRERIEKLLSNDLKSELARIEPGNYDILDFLDRAEKRAKGRDVACTISLCDLQTYLPCDLMNKVDIASMSHALEVRAPFLDYRLVEFAARMPIRYKIHGNTGKYILRKTFANLLPEKIGKRGKMGFGVPLDHWFRGPLKEYVREILFDSRTKNRGLFDNDYVESLVEDHIASRFDHAYRIWSLLILELWYREWVD